MLSDLRAVKSNVIYFVEGEHNYSAIHAVTLLVPNLAAKRNPVLPIGK